MFIGVTGVPGSGKTSTTIRVLCTDSQYFERPRYYHNVYLFLLDFQLLCSFAGFVGDYADSLKGAKKKSFMEALARIKSEGRDPELDDFPNLNTLYENYSPQKTFHKWVKKCYPKSQLKRLDEVIEVVGWDFHLKNIEHLNLHFNRLDDAKKWYALPPKSIIFQDECQKTYPLRPAGSSVPKWVSEYETHRHKSVDVFGVTQDITFLDAHLRKLIGQHWFIGDTDLHKVLYKRRGGIITKGKADKPFNHDSSDPLPSNKKIYGVYFSSPEDTHKKKIPAKFILLILLAMALIGGTLYFLLPTVIGLATTESVVEEKASPTPAPKEPSADQAGNDSASNSFINFGRNKGGRKKDTLLRFKTPEEYLEKMSPVIPDIPYSAPAYQHLLEVKSFPRPHCIVIYKNHDEDQKQCRCFSQQATPLDISERGCYAYVENGWFDFTEPDVTHKKRGRAKASGLAARAGAPPKS